MTSTRLRTDDRGSIAVISGLSVAVLAGIAGAATIYLQGLNAKEKVQASLDAAVLAATATSTGSSDSRRIEIAKAVFNQNIKEAFKGTDAEFTVSESPSFLVNQTEVSGSSSGKVKNTLGAALGISELEILVKARADKMQSDPLCILALNRTEPAAIQIYGNAHLNAHDCPVQANSSSGDGMRLYGNQSSATASQFGVTGNFSGTSWTPKPLIGTEPVSDPYASLPVPEPGTCADVAIKLKSTSFTLNPGTYCGGLNIGSGASVTLSPGIYIIKDGQFKVGSGATVTGEDVMIALVGADSYLYLNSNSATTLTSPQEGTYKNIQFMSDRDVSNSNSNEEWTTILGGATLDYDGVMYLPEQQVWASGTGHDIIIRANSPSLSIVADMVWAQGNVVFDVTQTDRRGIGEVAQAPGFAFGAKLSQ